MTVRISVIVPFHNSERYIARCLDGLLSQTYPRDLFEIIMIDNNSRDASADIVRSHPRIKLIAEPKQGSYAARNAGVSEALGEIVAFTDADCVPFSDWLCEIDTALSSNEIGIVLGSHAFARDSYPLSLLADYEDTKKGYVFARGNAAYFYGQTNNMAVRRTLLESEGGFVEALRGADTIFVRGCAERYSPGIVGYQARARVRHLEIDSVGRYLHKVFVYGLSSRRFGPGVSARPLANRDRWQILLRTIRERRYSFAQAASLTGVLLCGLVFWEAGASARL